MSKLKLTSLTKHYETPFISVYDANYENEHTGYVKQYDFISRSSGLTADNLGSVLPVNAVAILAVDPERHRILLTKEFRMTINQYLLSIPAGLMNGSETQEETVRRELREETGYTADRVRILPAAFSCIGLTDEQVAASVVTVKPGRVEPKLEEAEDISSEWYSYEEAYRLVMDPQAKIGVRAQLLVLLWLASEGMNVLGIRG
ncbi:MAG: NUDIX hydrolase [Anaerovoracaceae bacterium]